MRLYHYTCAHGVSAIGGAGILRPQPCPFVFGKPLLWLTDMDTPERIALGLTSRMLSCDRMEARYIVDTGTAREWLSSPERRVVPRGLLLDLETDGHDPRRWWITDCAVAGKRDRRYVLARAA